MDDMLVDFLDGKFAVEIDKKDMEQIVRFCNILQPHIRDYPHSTAYKWSSLWGYLSYVFSGPCHYITKIYVNGLRDISGASASYCWAKGMDVIPAEIFIANVLEHKTKPIQENEFWNILTG